MSRGSIQEENKTIVSIYAPNIGATKFIKQILTNKKGETENNTVIVGDFNTQLTSWTKPVRKSITKH